MRFQKNNIPARILTPLCRNACKDLAVVVANVEDNGQLRKLLRSLILQVSTGIPKI